MKSHFKNALSLILLTLFILTGKTQTTKLVGAGQLHGGSIFAFNEDGSEPEKWADFTVGEDPRYTTLIENNGKLFGMTQSGGVHGVGIVFSLNLDGSGYTKLHDFDSDGGANPTASLILHDGKLWGLTNKGGTTDSGVIFNINQDGSGFEKVYDFEI